MRDVHRGFLKQQFDGLVYVYAYIDPRTDTPFFVGHGSANWDTAHLSDRDAPFHTRVRQLGRHPQIRRLAERLTRPEAVQLVRFLVLSLGCEGCEANPGPLLNRDHCLTGIVPGKGVYKVRRGTRSVWVATIHQTWIGQANTYDDAMRIREAEELRAKGKSKRAWKKEWKERTGRRVSG